MATDHYEDDLELDDELADDEELDLEVLDESEDVDYDEDFELAPADAEIETIEEEEDTEDEEVAEETSEDEEDLEDEDEEEDEETLEVLLGPDSDSTVTTARSRVDESGDAPPGEGEFTCRSCFLVKRRAQLADATAMICLDCA
jgi:hypothetical protein